MPSGQQPSNSDEAFDKRLRKVAAIKSYSFDRFMHEFGRPEKDGATYEKMGKIVWGKFAKVFPEISLHWLWNGVGEMYNDLSSFSRLKEYLSLKQIPDDDFYEKTQLEDGFLDEPVRLDNAHLLAIAKAFPVSVTWLATGIGDAAVDGSTTLTRDGALQRIRLCISLAGSTKEVSLATDYSEQKVKTYSNGNPVPVGFVEVFCQKFPFSIDWIRFGFGSLFTTLDTFLSGVAQSKGIDMFNISNAEVKVLATAIDFYEDITSRLEKSDPFYYSARFRTETFGFADDELSRYPMVAEQFGLISHQLAALNESIMKDTVLLRPTTEFKTYKEYRSAALDEFYKVRDIIPAINKFVIQAQSFIAELEIRGYTDPLPLEDAK